MARGLVAAAGVVEVCDVVGANHVKRHSALGGDINRVNLIVRFLAEIGRADEE